MLNDCSISSAVPFIVAMAAQNAGAEAAPILRAAGLDPGAPPIPDAHVDAAAYFAAWRVALAALPDRNFPLRAATAFQLEDHEVFGFLAMSCETLGQAYERTAKYRALYCIGARWELYLEDDATRLVWYPWPGDPADLGYRAAMDFAVADMAKAIKRLGNTGPTPTAVKLVHDTPHDASAYARHYGVSPSYGAPLYELVYPKALCDLPVATFNSRLRDYFEQECRAIAEKQGATTSIVQQVRAQLTRAMDGGDVAVEAVAKKLGLSSRSLQRKLSDEGTRYNDLLADVRTEFAKRYLARGSISASEVAYLIGFTEPPAFFKAFKRWTGMTPREFQLGAAA